MKAIKRTFQAWTIEGLHILTKGLPKTVTAYEMLLHIFFSVLQTSIESLQENLYMCLHTTVLLDGTAVEVGQL